MIYANLEKASAAAEQIAQINAHSASAVGAYCCDRAAHSCAVDFHQQKQSAGSSSALPVQTADDAVVTSDSEYASKSINGRFSGMTGIT
jgi:hypothetical protein